MFFLSIVVFKVQNLFIWLVDGILGKWGSLLARIDIWERTLRLISERPILGHGAVYSFVRAKELHLGWGAVHAHNLMLEILYQSLLECAGAGKIRLDGHLYAAV